MVIIPLLSTLGRVKCYSGTFIAGGICCGLVAIISLAMDAESMVWLPVTVAMTGKSNQSFDSVLNAATYLNIY